MCQFANLKRFDVVDGVAVDYTHGILLGVSKQLLKLWLDSQFSGEDWYCGTLVALIDERLMSIKPPNVITRVPRSLEHHRKYWKGIYINNFVFSTYMYMYTVVRLILIHQQYAAMGQMPAVVASTFCCEK